MVDSIAVTYVGAIRNLQSRAGDYWKGKQELCFACYVWFWPALGPIYTKQKQKRKRSKKAKKINE